MPKRLDPKEQVVLERIGMCLLIVQQAERAISDVVEKIFDRRHVDFATQSASEKKQTLGDILMRLKKSASIEHRVKEKLFRFLEMRNILAHDLSKVSGWNLKTEEGRNAAKVFLNELIVASAAVTALCVTLFAVWAKDDCGEDLFDGEESEVREIVRILEARFGPMARKIMAGRYSQPQFVRRSKSSPE
jgi:hypothetical protein